MLDADSSIIELPSGKLYKRPVNGEVGPEPDHIISFREACNAFVSNDSDTRLLKDRSILVAHREESFLIQGESGTGKELIARIAHGERLGRFVAVNVCAVTETIFESELFGHVRGAFTGATKSHTGLIEDAENGTLFLDEIGDMNLALQAKMLRVIQNRTYRKVGSCDDEPVRCRIVAATHRNLRQMIKEGQFRLDLYQRLEALRLQIKPLRERFSDMELYVGSNFLITCKFLREHRESFYFSGNVRQLQNLKLKCIVFGESALTLDDVL